MPATPGDGHQQADTGELKAGREDGDEQHQQTDEERMLNEIAQQKELLDAMHGDSYSDICAKAPHAKKLGQLEFSYQLMMEKKRLSSVLAKFEEEHGPLYSEPCLICLEDIHVHASANLIEKFLCCGGFICTTCLGDIKASGVGLSKCPLCRESIGNTTEAEAALKLSAFVKRGVAWAQTDLGTRMVYGIGGFKKQEKPGVKWLNKAVAQNHPAALYFLSTLYGDGMASVLLRSEEKAKELMMKSANLGYALANSWLARSSCYGSCGFDRDQEEAYFRASVAFSLGDTQREAADVLGRLHCGERTIPEPSPYLACYYLNIAANGDDDGSACLGYSQALAELCKHLHDGSIAIPGSEVMPAAFFWLRQSRDLGRCSDAVNLLKQWETSLQSSCANCGKDALADEKFKQCSKCKSQWYCSKECQVEAWKSGHKKDCKRARILKFEDYLNAD